MIVLPCESNMRRCTNSVFGAFDVPIIVISSSVGRGIRSPNKHFIMAKRQSYDVASIAPEIKRKRLKLTETLIEKVTTSKNNKITLASPQNEHNGTRLIYTILIDEPTNNERFALLNNGYYLTRTTRSDEKLRFTEGNLRSMIECIIFMSLLNASPENSIGELSMTANDIKYIEVIPNFTFNDSTSLCDFCDLLDRLFGVGFSLIARRTISSVWRQWLTKYRYVSCMKIKGPSPRDYLVLYKFLNVTSPYLSDTTKFLTFNNRDGKIFLQNAVKRLY